jgi:4-amino-4-deoxy-L-arabinose transferase-like glycosyltransferase
MNRAARVFLVVPITLLFFYLAVSSLHDDSPTMDEQNHIARGLAFLRTGDPRLSLEHPPLVNALTALPLLTMPELRLPTDDPSWEAREGWYRFAELFMWEYNDDASRVVFLARLPIVFLTIGMAVVGWRFAEALWGAPAGLLAYAFFLLDPNLLAHGRYATTDMGATAFVLLATYLLWRAWTCNEWCWRRTLLAGVGLGLAFGAKMSTLAFVPIFVLLALLPLFGTDWDGTRASRRLLQLLLAGGISVIVVWVVFGLEWGAVDFVSPDLVITGRMTGAVAQVFDRLDGAQVPMPTYWQGIEQILILSKGQRPSFLLGETALGGFDAYFPVAFAVKTPIAIMVLLGMSLFVFLRREARAEDRRRMLFLLVPAVAYFLVSIQSALNIGYRHLLPLLPFLYVMVAGALTRSWEGRGYRALRWVGAGAAAAFIITTVAIYPHFLSYFNLLGGGPENGYKVLIDSNIDWGQDLIRLKDWMTLNEVDAIKLSYFGTADPAYYGINYEPLPGLPRHADLWWDVPFDSRAPEPGTYVISASNIWELPLQEEKYVFPWFRAREPDDRVGYSLLIYDVK